MNQKDKFDQFVDFIAHFSHELSSGTSPEFALLRTTDYFSDQTPEPVKTTVYEIIEGTKSFAKAWKDLGRIYTDTNYSRLVELMGRFLEKGSKVGGERMLEVIKQIRKNNEITKARKNLVMGQKIKVLALSSISSIVMGMITALAPMLSLAFINGVFTTPTPGNSPSLPFSVLLALSLTVIITGHQLNHTVEGSSKNLFLNILIFGCTYIFTSQLLAAFM